MKNTIKWLLNNIGHEIRPFPTPAEARLLNYLNKTGITICIDVGANNGQFAERLKKIRFKGSIFSFEPQREVFNVLESKSKKHTNWQVKHSALGDFDGTIEMNISQDPLCSSILPMLSTHEQAQPNSSYVGVETVPINKLDTIISSITAKTDKIYLKIDTQGFEQQVLKGAEQTLKNVYVLELEMSCVELYKGEVLFNEMRKRVEDWGFTLFSIESGFANKETGELLQVETIFIRKGF